MKITGTTSNWIESPRPEERSDLRGKPGRGGFKAFPEWQVIYWMARHDMLRANMNDQKGILPYFALFADKCLTRLRIYPDLHPILKAAMFGIKAIEEFLVFFQLEASAIAACTLRHLFRHLSLLV
jgi:hypothetical protein